MITNSYSHLKAFLNNYVLQDPRIHPNGFIWGMSERILKAMASKPVYPYFWVEDVRYHFDAPQSNTSLTVYYELSISIKANSPIGNTLIQEGNVDLAKEIMDDFLAYLVAQHQADNITFDLDRTVADLEFQAETDDNWGWAFDVMIGVRPGTFCAMSTEFRHQVATLKPVFVTGETKLAIDVDGQLSTVDWLDESAVSQVLHAHVENINSIQSKALASTDGVYLYLRSISQTGGFAYDPISDNHKWTEPFLNF